MVKISLNVPERMDAQCRACKKETREKDLDQRIKLSD